MTEGPLPLSHHGSTYPVGILMAAEVQHGGTMGKIDKDLPTSVSLQGNLLVFFILAYREIFTYFVDKRNYIWRGGRKKNLWGR